MTVTERSRELKEMQEIMRLVGECPLGKLWKKMKVDVFGFVFDFEYIKEVRPEWEVYQFCKKLDLEVAQYSFSDYVHYAKKECA